MRFSKLGFLLTTGYYLLTTVILSGCADVDDIAFCKNVMTQLVQGRYACRRSIAWAELSMMQKDIGAEYAKYANESDRLGYERAFIDSFKRSFNEQKGSINNFYGWRKFGPQEQDFVNVRVDLKNSNYFILMTVKREAGRKKLVGLKLFQVQDAEKLQQFEKQYK